MVNCQLMSNKVICAMCKYENKGMCLVKKIGVHVNKRRKCNLFSYEEGKVRPKETLPTVYVPYMDKKTLKNMKKVVNTENPYPLTGDLSQFKSTAK